MSAALVILCWRGTTGCLEREGDSANGGEAREGVHAVRTGTARGRCGGSTDGGLDRY